jgi:serine/threonine protein kinase
MYESTGASKPSTVFLKRAGDIRQVSAALSVRFEVLKHIGASGTAELYLARDKKAPEPPVMLRVLRDQAARDPRQVELFYLEADTAAELRHRNIVKSSRATSADGFHFMVTEHKHGVETLRDLLGRKGWLEPSLAVGITCQVAAALDYAHGLGVLHLNLQPENLLIDPDGNVLVTNFGIPRRDDLDWAHKDRSQRMSSQYVSPEQAKCDRVDQWSDIYSLGVVLFEMLTDRLPFNAESQEVIKRKHITQTPLQPHLFRASISRPLSEITVKLLEKKPGGRIQNGAALVSSLGRLIDIDQPASARPAAERGAERIEGVRDEPAYPVTGGSQEIASAEEAESQAAEADDRQAYESPAINIIDHPVRQFYESTSAPEAVTGLRRPFSQQPTAPAPSGRGRLPLYAMLIIGALVVAAAAFVMARANYLQGFFRPQTTEIAPAAVDQSEPQPSSDAKADPVQSEGQGATEPPQGPPALPASVAGASVRAATPRVRQSPRRSKYKPRKYRLRRRAR